MQRQQPLDLNEGPATARRCEARIPRPALETSAARTASPSASPPPRVAFCFAGAARAFAAPLVLEALRNNVVAPLAGLQPRRSGTRLFLSLKLADSAKRISGVSFGQHVSPLTPLVSALTSSWLAPLIGEAIIVNGSGAIDPLTPGASPQDPYLNAQTIAIVPANNSLWRSYRATACPSTGTSSTIKVGAQSRGEASTRSHNASMLSTDGARTIRATSGGGVPRRTPAMGVPGRPTVVQSAGSCCRKSAYLNEGNNEERLIHQHLGLAWCAAAIVRYETRRHQHVSHHGHSDDGGAATARPTAAGTASGSSPGGGGHIGRSNHRFEVIVFARPDLVWWQPLPAWCEWAPRTRMLSCDRPGCDMVWVAPREYLGRLMGQAAIHRDCADGRAPPHGAGRARNVRLIASCCSTSEWLLWYTQSSRGVPRGQPAWLEGQHEGGATAAAAAAAPVAAPIGTRGVGSALPAAEAAEEATATEIPIVRSSALEPDRAHMSLLRDGAHACERSLSRGYESHSHALWLQQRQGLSLATGGRLRRLFGAGNVTACQRALQP